MDAETKQLIWQKFEADIIELVNKDVRENPTEFDNPHTRYMFTRVAIMFTWSDLQKMILENYDKFKMDEKEIEEFIFELIEKYKMKHFHKIWGLN